MRSAAARAVTAAVRSSWAPPFAHAQLSPPAWLSASNRAAASAPPRSSSFRHAFPIQGAGCAVTVRVGDASPATITIGAPDAVEVWWEGAAGAGASTGAGHSPPVSATQDGPAISVIAPPGALAPGTPLRLAIPGRYAGLDITTAGGAVSVEGVTEAGLRVASAGGDVCLGDARTTAAAVATGGGALTARILSGDDVCVSTGGGDATIGRLVARTGAVDTRPGETEGERRSTTSSTGALSINAALGDRFAFAARAPITIATLHARETAAVTSAAGPVTLRGVDGNADVRVGAPGGRISLHLLAGAAGVRVTAPGGTITAAADPVLLAGGGGGEAPGLVLLGGGAGAAGGLLCDRAAAAGAALDARWQAACTPPAEEGEAALAAVLSSTGRGGRGGMRGGDEDGAEVGGSGDEGSSRPLVLLDARPGGRVTLRQASWFEGAMERAAAAGRVVSGGGGGGT